MILRGDALDHLRRLEDESFEAVVTDPPYGLSRQPDMAEVLRHWLAGDDYQHRGGGFMGESWDSFVPGPAIWREALRVLKPGGYLLAFGGSRTSDLLSTAIRLAGFEVRDTITWLYGQGFPKSRDISKALDERAGAERPVVGTKLGQPGYSLSQGDDNSVTYGYFGNPAAEVEITAAVTPEARRWEGWGTALKPGYEPIIVARRPFRGPVELNVVEHGTGALHVDAVRIPVEGVHPSVQRRRSTTPSSVADRRAGEGRAIVNRSSDEVYQRDRPGETGEAAGRFPPNVLLTHAPECNGECVEWCPVAQIDAQSGHLHAGGAINGTEPSRPLGGPVYNPGPSRSAWEPYGDGGPASRFFPTTGWDRDELVAEARMLYAAKASTNERAAGIGFNPHPTVKPIDLMRWLVRLVLSPGGRALDPFAGSGTTLCAAAVEGFTAVGIERKPEFAELAERRLAFWLSAPTGMATDRVVDGDRKRQALADTGQGSLLDPS